MARIPKRVAGPIAVPAVVGTRYTVPALTNCILRHIHVSNPTAGQINFTLTIGADAAGVRLFDAYPIPAGTVLDHFCYYVLVPAEIVQSNASATGLVLTIDGDEIVLG